MNKGMTTRDKLKTLREMDTDSDAGRALTKAEDKVGVKLFSCGRPPWVRSEERRVGKECRSRWSPYH